MEKYIETPFKPGWITNNILDYDENFIKIIRFYLFETPCEGLSSRSITIEKYGWSKDAWKKQLIQRNIETQNPQIYKNIFTKRTYYELRKALISNTLINNFTKKSNEIVVCYQNQGYNKIMSVFYHIRNCLAHGRFRISNGDKKIYYLEDGKKIKGKYIVVARMIIYEETLLKWIYTITKSFKN